MYMNNIHYSVKRQKSILKGQMYQCCKSQGNQGWESAPDLQKVNSNALIVSVSESQWRTLSSQSAWSRTYSRSPKFSKLCFASSSKAKEKWILNFQWGAIFLFFVPKYKTFQEHRGGEEDNILFIKKRCFKNELAVLHRDEKTNPVKEINTCMEWTSNTRIEYHQVKEKEITYPE